MKQTQIQQRLCFKTTTKRDTLALSLSLSRPSSSPTDNHAFYASLTPNERIAHTIAAERLGTSYDVTRTHGFLKWVQGTQSK